VIKHRQLARQVGAFGAIAIKSSTDFNDMIFPMGSIFIFGSWVCEADDKGNLHGRLIETLEAHEGLTLSTKFTEDLEKLMVSESTRTPDNDQSQFDIRVGFPLGVLSGFFQRQAKVLSQSDSRTQHQLYKRNSNLLQVSSKKLSRFPTGLNNMTKTYQGLLGSMAGRARRLHLTGA
jgi:hypothetical protein